MDLFSRMSILTFFTRICFCGCQICEIDINQYCACKCNHFSHVKHTDLIHELCFSIRKTRDILQYLAIKMKALSIISNYPTRRTRVYQYAIINYG